MDSNELATLSELEKTKDDKLVRLTETLVTTEPVSRGEVSVGISVETLESSVTETQGMPLIHDHNPLALPLGKSERAWVVKHSETQASLVQNIYVFTDEPERFIHELSRTSCVHLPYTDSPERFAIESVNDGPSVSVDMSALKKKSHDKLIDDLRDHDDEIKLNFHDRRDPFPVPLVTFVAGMSLVATFMLAFKIALIQAAISGRLSKWAEETVKWIKNDCIPALKTYRQHKNAQAVNKVDEWIVLTFDARNHDGPLIELVIASKHCGDLPLESIGEFAKVISSYSDLVVTCDKMVFAYFPDQGTCQFRYALTKDGGVIGTETCFEESLLPHKKWLSERRNRGRIAWTLVTLDDGEMAVRLYSIGQTGTTSLGLLSLTPDSATMFKDTVGVDDGVLRKFRFVKNPDDSNENETLSGRALFSLEPDSGE